MINMRDKLIDGELFLVHLVRTFPHTDYRFELVGMPIKLI
jgi:hypothetical protein